MGDYQEYQKEALEVNLKLDRYEISEAQWFEEIEILREKYGIPSLKDELGDKNQK